MRYTKDNNVITDEFLVLDKFIFNSIVSNFKRLFDDGLQACFFDKQSLKVITYCEGDVTEIKCVDEKSFNDEIETHHKFYLNN